MPKGEQHSWQTVLVRLAAGDQAAFEEIYHEYYTGLLFFARRFLPLHMAEEVLSDTFLKLWQSGGSFGSHPQLHQWLRVTVRNACLNLLLQEKNTSEKQRQLLHLSEEEYEHRYFEDRLYADLQQRILDEIGRLHPQQQRIIRMFFLQGMDNAGIAAHLNISVQAVKNQKVTALKALRKAFAGEDFLIYTLFAGGFFSHF